jgi:hypothetical protein
MKSTLDMEFDIASIRREVDQITRSMNFQRTELEDAQDKVNKAQAVLNRLQSEKARLEDLVLERTKDLKR